MLITVIFALTFGSIALLTQVFLPLIKTRYASMHEEKAKVVSRRLDEMYIWVGYKKLILILGLVPIITGVVLFILFTNPAMLVAGFVIGLALPSLALNIMDKQRKEKFQAQLVDGLISISQSMKAGLSFMQALEILVEEMPRPISQEFALIIKENRMGKTFEQSFQNLNKRMQSEDLNLITTAILVAQETGGNITEAFIKLAESMRRKKRIREQIKTLTTQARWQGIIMSALPVIFAVMVFNMNPHFFDIMLESDMGRLLLAWCVISEVIGAVFLNRLSKIEV